MAFTKNHGFVLHRISDGECCIVVPFQEAFERPGGVVSGQVFMAAADVAMWLAIKTKLGLPDASVTAEMKTNFLSSVRKADFRCTTKILKLGRRLIYGVAECVDEDGKLPDAPHDHVYSLRIIALLGVWFLSSSTRLDPHLAHEKHRKYHRNDADDGGAQKGSPRDSTSRLRGLPVQNARCTRSWKLLWRPSGQVACRAPCTPRPFCPRR